MTADRCYPDNVGIAETASAAPFPYPDGAIRRHSLVSLAVGETGHSKLNRMRILVRNVLLLVLLVGILLLLLEGRIRLLAPKQAGMGTYWGTIAVNDSVLGHRLRPGAVAVDHAIEFTARYAINEQGLRDDVVYNAHRGEGRTRFLLLGDSFAFGTGTDYEHIWPVLVEQTLAARGRRVELVKAGVPAYDTRLQVLYLNQMFPQTTPDAVILAFLPSHLFTNRPLRGDSGGDDRAQQVVVSADEKNETLHVVTLFQRLVMNSDRLYSFLYRITPRRQYFEVPPTPELQSRLSTTSSLLREAARFCRERGVPLVVLSIPQQFQVLVEGRGYRYKGMDMHYVDRELGRLAVQEGFRWISTLDTLASAYREKREDLYYRFDGHFNERGNRVVAEYFADQLELIVLAAGDAAPLH